MASRQLIVTIGLVILATLALWFVYDVADKRLETADSQTHQSGTALIGGPFSLLNQDGETITDQSFPTKHKLVYFGFSHCPDVCPTDLLAITQTMQFLGENANKVQPIFITVDPERDTPEALKSYAKNFYPSFQMLTGSKQAISETINAYKVFASKVTSESVGEYLMNHSAFIYLMDKEGNYLTHFSHGTKPDVMAQQITSRIQSSQ